MHVQSSGSPAAPPVLLSSGLGGAWYDWKLLMPLLETTYRVIVFDRPGTGASAPATEIPSLRGAVTDLACLAEWAGAPVIVVAHSYAAFHAEALARIHPGLVSGLVLVDPSCEASVRRRGHLAAALTPVYRAAGFALEATRLARLIGPAGRRLAVRRGEVASPEEIRAVYGDGRVLGEIGAENQAYREEAFDLHRLRQRRKFPEIPVVVVTALRDFSDPTARDAWRRGHAELAAMTPYGRQIALPNSRHLIAFDHPEVIAHAVASLAELRSAG